MDKIITRRYEVRLRDGTVGTITTGASITVNDYICLDSGIEDGELFGKFGIVEEIINSVELYSFDAVHIVFFHEEDYVEIKGAFESKRDATKYVKDLEELTKKYLPKDETLIPYMIKKVMFVKKED